MYSDLDKYSLVDTLATFWHGKKFFCSFITLTTKFVTWASAEILQYCVSFLEAIITKAPEQKFNNNKFSSFFTTPNFSFTFNAADDDGEEIKAIFKANRHASKALYSIRWL